MAVVPTDNIQQAVSALRSDGGEIIFQGGLYRNAVVVVTQPGVRFTRRGRQVRWEHAGGTTGLEVKGDGFDLSGGFHFSTSDPSAPNTRGVVIRSKESVLMNPWFSRYGNQVAQHVYDIDVAPQSLRYEGEDAVWADWNHLYSPHFEFVYAGLVGAGTGTNVMVSNLVARGQIGLGGGVWTLMRGTPAGSSIKIHCSWVAHAKWGYAYRLEQEPGVSRHGGCELIDFTVEPGAGNLGKGVYVGSKSNGFARAKFIGGTVGFHFADSASDNEIIGEPRRTSQGTVGPPVDEGNLTAQRWI